MSDMEFILEKQENRIWRNVAAYNQYKNDLPAGRYKIVIQPVDKRSLQQNSWFHAVLPEITLALRGMGFDDVKTSEDAKEVVKGLFFKKTISNGSEEIEIIQPTSKTAKLDFTQKAEEIIKWAAEYLGIQIAPPGVQTEIFQENL